MKAAIYIRLSSYRGTDDPSTSPARQEEACRGYAEARGWEVVEVVRDLDVSGTDRGMRLNRPGLQQVRALFGVIDVIIFAKLDRLARNVRDFSTFAEEAQDHNVALVSVAENLDLSTSQGRFLTNMMASFAEMEGAVIAERTAAGRAEALKQGRWVGGTIPFGSRVVDNPDGGGKVLEIDPDEAAILRELVGRYLDGTGAPTLTRWLNDRGVKTRRGKPWGAAVVRQLLRDHAKASPVLTGPERHALADALEARSRPHNAPPADNSTALLTGILTCASCGSGVHRDSEGSRQRPTYVCNNNTGDSRANHARVIAEDAEALITRVFLDDWSEYRPTVRVVPAEKWDLDVAALRDKVDALMASFPSVTPEERPSMLSNLADAEAELDTLLASPPPRVFAVQQGDATISEMWERGTPLDRRALLKTYLGSVLCTPARDDSGRLRTTEERLTIPRLGDPDPEPVAGDLL